MKNEYAFRVGDEIFMYDDSKRHIYRLSEIKDFFLKFGISKEEKGNVFLKANINYIKESVIIATADSADEIRERIKIIMTTT